MTVLTWQQPGGNIIIGNKTTPAHICKQEGVLPVTWQWGIILRKNEATPGSYLQARGWLAIQQHPNSTVAFIPS